jgi:diacylglycerol kinase family enzyme
MPAPFGNVRVIINPAAGRDEPILNPINDIFGQHGIAWDARVTHKEGDATKLARKAVKKGCDLVVSYGGDGTLMEVVNGLMGSDVLLGILPGGTGNAVAAELGIPEALPDALRLIATSPGRRRIDVGQVNDRYFLLRAYTGVSSDHSASREMKNRLGALAYPLSALRFLKEHDPARFKVVIDGKPIEDEGVMCYVNNIAYASAPRLQDWFEKVFLDVQAHDGEDVVAMAEPVLNTINPSDGLLDVVLLTQDPFTLQAIKSFVLQDGQMQATAHFLQGKRISITADPPQPLWIDGEACGETPVDIQIVPEAIEVIVEE